MKKIVLGLLLTISGIVYGQNDLAFNYKPKTDFNIIPVKYDVYSNSVNLHLTKNKSYNVTGDQNFNGTFAVILLSGLAFTTASILEGSYQYGTYKPNPQPGNPHNTSYVIPTFWEQTPRQIMLCVGIGFTVVGGIGMIQSK